MMADLDDDAVARPGGAADNTEIDLSDETQDFRFLASLSQTSLSQQSLPRRGEKDFESHGTQSQSSVLAASRQAMHDALSHTRTHNPKTAIVGFYNPDYSSDNGEGGNKARGRSDGGVVMIERPTGPHFKTVGKADSLGHINLLPEEALYLIERGSLDLRWTGVEELEGLPLSLQAAYTYFIGDKGLSLERYAVYAGLKRSGYIVQRAATWYPEDHDKVLVAPRRGNTALKFDTGEAVSAWSRFFARIYQSLVSSYLPSQQNSRGPLVQPGLYRSYTAIYKQLALIPFHDPSHPTAREQAASSSRSPLNAADSADGSTAGSTSSAQKAEVKQRIRPAFNVWKPSHSTTFKKSSPPAPDFRIAVLDARHDPFPTYDQFDDVLECMPYDPAMGAAGVPVTDSVAGGVIGAGGGGNAGQLYGRIRHGHRHVILAVVDQGIVSYVRVSDAAFGLEPVWQRQEKGGKGRGRGGGRGGGSGGRGRGRGQGRR